MSPDPNPDRTAPAEPNRRVEDPTPDRTTPAAANRRVSYLSPAAADQPDGPVTLSLPQGPGEPYQMLGEIGRGGMGVVLRGRDPDLGRDLAIKVLNAELVGHPAYERRFVEEAQVGGQLQHPGIVPVYDLGRLGDDRPYFAMKLVKGRTLADLLKDRPDPAHDRGRFLRVFQQIAQASGYAHSRGVIHRDLKPSNVMVGSFGEVLVMDWGLAKVLGRPERESADPTVAEVTEVKTARAGGGGDTAAGSALGTPAYMPPEQAGGEVGKMDARSDVFGLGAILCVVLTGKPPYQGKTGEEVRLKAVRAEQADALGRLDGCGADAELVALCKQCLAADRAARPADGGAVAEAVGAYLTGVEDRARRAEVDRAAAEARAAEEANTRREAEAKAREERKRRRAQLALAGVVGLVLAGGGALAWWEDKRSTADRVAAAAREKDEGERRDRNAEAMATLLKQCETALEEDDADRAAAALAEAERRAGEGGSDDLRDRLARCRADLAMLRDLDRFEYQMSDQARDQSQALKSGQALTADLAAAFARFGFDPGAVPAGELARRATTSPIRTRLLTGLDKWLAATGSADVLAVLRAADPDPYRTAFRAAVVDRSAALDELIARPDALTQPAWFAVQLIHIGGLPPRPVGAILRAAWDRRPADFGLAMSLGKSVPRNQLAGAAEREMWYRTAIALRPRSAAAWMNLGTALKDKGDIEAAVAAHREAIRLDPGDPSPHFNLGNALRVKKDLAGAIEQYREAVRVDPNYPGAHHNLGNALLDTDLPGAIACYREAVRLEPGNYVRHFMLGTALERSNDLDGAALSFRQATRLNLDDAEAHRRLGQVLHGKGNLDGAVPAYREAIRLDRDHAPTHSALGRVFIDLGQMDKAEAAQREALRHDPKHAQAYDGLSAVLRTKGDLAGAFAVAWEAIRLDPKLATAYVNLGVALRDQKKPREAAAAQREAIYLDPGYAVAHYNLGVALADMGERDRAIAAYREAIRLDPTIPSAHTNLGAILINRGEVDAAITCLREAVRLRPDRADYKRNLQVALAFQASQPRKPAAVAPPPREVKR